MTTRLKKLFQRRELFVIVGGKTPMEAKMAELLDFDAFYMSGADIAWVRALTSAHLHGRTDYGTCIRALVDNARRIAMTADIPVFADMETGFGDALSTPTSKTSWARPSATRGVAPRPATWTASRPPISGWWTEAHPIRTP